MAVSFINSAVPGGNPTTSATITIPTVSTGDALILLVASRDSTGAGTLSVTDNDTGGNTWTKVGNSTDHKLTLWSKIASSATSAKTITISNAVGSCAAVLKVFRGTASSPVTDVVIEANASANETHAAFTPTNANSMVCFGVVNYANDNAVTSVSSATHGAMSSVEKLSTGGLDCGANFSHVGPQSGAVSTGSFTWAQTDGTTYSVSFALAPGANNYTSTPSGSLSFTGAVARSVSRALSATLGFTGATTKRTGRNVAGSVSFTGSVTKRSDKGQTATVSFSTTFSPELIAPGTPALVIIHIHTE